MTLPDNAQLPKPFRLWPAPNRAACCKKRPNCSLHTAAGRRAGPPCLSRGSAQMMAKAAMVAGSVPSCSAALFFVAIMLGWNCCPQNVKCIDL